MNSLKELSHLFEKRSMESNHPKETQRDVKKDFDFVAEIMQSLTNLNRKEREIANLIVTHGITAGIQIYIHKHKGK